MKYEYSSGFQNLVASPDRLKDLLINCSFSGAFEAWERRKAFIAETIHKDGTFLDTGAGNGFLLKCLQEWSKHSITPYGIDISQEYIRKAKELFPGQQDNFTALNVNEVENISQYLPDRYNFVYFSSDWSGRKLTEHDTGLINNLKNHVNPGGRLILGFYGQGKQSNLESVHGFEKSGIEFNEVLENPMDTNVVAWIDFYNRN